MEVHRLDANSPKWLHAAYDYIRIDSFCFGQNIPPAAEFEHDTPLADFHGILVTEANLPVCGLKISYPKKDVARIERVCTIREKQKSGYGRVMIEEAEKWILENGYRHVIIVSQDRAQGFYEKCGYVENPELTFLSILPDGQEPPKRPAHHESGFVPDFTTVMVEKYLKESA